MKPNSRIQNNQKSIGASARVFTSLLLGLLCLAPLSSMAAGSNTDTPDKSAKVSVCYAAVDIDRLANAIWRAEGGNKTRHPYGILKKFKKTTPRQACINTIKSNLRRWNGKGDFIIFLSKTYCPIGASNDPTGLNKNWVKNVSHFYKQKGGAK
jgi:hypothetical protein